MNTERMDIPMGQLIIDLQSDFDGRSRLNKAILAIKSYTKDASFFFSYTDGWGKKQYVNLPIQREDILPIMEKYVANINAAIERQIIDSLTEDIEEL